MSHRDKLIREVKMEYAYLADLQSQEHHMDNGAALSGAWYEALLGRVIRGIEGGQFDEYDSGLQIVEAVANNRTALKG